MSDHFTEDDARRILARAAERQEAAERARLDTGDRVTLTELKSIAHEVGIDPTYVQAAAGELVLRKEASPVGMTMGIPREIHEMRMLPGTVSDRQWEQMVGVFRDAFGRSGIVSQFGEVREWVSTNDGREGMPVTVRVEPGESGTLMKMSQSTKAMTLMAPVLGGSFGAIGGFLAAMMAVGNFETAAWGLPALLFGIAILSVLGVAYGGRVWVKSQTALFDSVADKVELIGRPEDLEA